MKITLADTSTVVCDDEPIGGGAEGSVYRSADGRHAIKLYLAAESTRRSTLESIINEFNPVRADSDWKQLFCWPEDVVISPKLGVKMPLASKELRRLDEFLLSKFRNRMLSANQRGNYAGYLRITIRMASIMSRLHHSGLCYADPSWRNFLVDPRDGKTVAIDLDGLVVPNFMPPRVDGTPEFQAPELVMRTASPSIETDRHALAVLIYRTLIFHPTPYGLGSVHPLGAGLSALQGSKIHPGVSGEEQDFHAFGDLALFIEHQTDHSNRPSEPFSGSLTLGHEFYGLMLRAFVNGLKDPQRRPHAAEWEEVLVRLYDRLIPCANDSCEMKYFVMPESTSLQCPFCKTIVCQPARIPILRLYRPVVGSRRGRFQPDNNYFIVGWPGRTIHNWHVDPGKMPRPGIDPRAVAHFEYDERSGLWYVMNDTLDELTVNDLGIARPISRGSSVELTEGLRLVLGDPQHSRLAHVQMMEIV